jgi:hypothetical protein
MNRTRTRARAKVAAAAHNQSSLIVSAGLAVSLLAVWALLVSI